MPESGAVKDDQAGNAVTLEKSPSLENQDLQSTYALRTHSVRDSWKQGVCVHCGEDFEKKTTWQKFCKEACRVAAYELRTGKKAPLKSKK